MHPHNEAVDLVSSEDDDDVHPPNDDPSEDVDSDDSDGNNGDRGDEVLAAFDNNIPLVDMAMNNASALANCMLSHGFTASKEIRRDFVVAHAMLA